MEQIRSCEREMIRTGTNAYELMQRAAQSLSELVMEKLPCGGDVLFVCGGGNNGGDGFVAAQILYQKGCDVAVLCLSDRFSENCARAKAAYQGEFFTRIPRRKYSVIVECLLGTGIDRAPEGDIKTLIEFINSSGSYVISCDLPGGLGENGVAFSPCVRADCTLTVGALKNALFMADGKDFSGEIRLAKIGLEISPGTEIWGKTDVSRYFPKRKSNVNKGDFGAAAIVAGLPQYPGAAFLAAEACLRSGAGYTKLYAEEPFYGQAVGKLPSVVLRRLEGAGDELLLADAIALGSGAGLSEQLYKKICKLLKNFNGILLLDADALNTLAHYGVEVLKNKSCRVILTPHIKEFSRLIHKSVNEVLENAVQCASKFAKEYDLCVVLKNNATVISDGKRTAINVTGSPALSKGGSGDVLCGFLAGTCARLPEPYEAACISCYLLGSAGELAAKKMGEYSSCASDVINELPRAILDLQ